MSESGLICVSSGICMSQCVIPISDRLEEAPGSTIYSMECYLLLKGISIWGCDVDADGSAMVLV